MINDLYTSERRRQTDGAVVDRDQSLTGYDTSDSDYEFGGWSGGQVMRYERDMVHNLGFLPSGAAGWAHGVRICINCLAAVAVASSRNAANSSVV